MGATIITGATTTSHQVAENIARRICIDLLTPPEIALYKALAAVEEAGADPLLTDAVILIQQAREKVAEYIDRRLNEHKIG